MVKHLKQTGWLTALGGSGLLSAAIIWWWTQPYTLSATIEFNRKTFAKFSQFNLARSWQLVGAWLVLWVLYGLAWWCSEQGRAAMLRHPYRWLLVISTGWLLMALPWLNAYPGSSLDVFDYNFRGHMLAHLHASPLAVAPSEVIKDDVYPYLAWRTIVDSYGPVWEYLSAAFHSVAGDQPSVRATVGAGITAYRVSALAASLGCGLIVWGWLRRTQPAWAATGLLLWLWNPLVLYETANGGHNDAWMLLPLLVAAGLLWRGHAVWSILLVVIAALVKITAMLVLPVWALWFWRQHGWRATLKVAIYALLPVLALVWLAYAPLGGTAIFPRWLRERQPFTVASFADWWAIWQTHTDAISPATQAAAGRLATYAFAIALVLLLIVCWRKRIALLPATWVLLLVYLLIGSFWFQQWYVLWLLPWALLAHDRRLIWLSIGYALLASSLMFIFAWWNGWLVQHWGIFATRIMAGLPNALMLLLALGWLSVTVVQRRRSLAQARRSGQPVESL